MDACPTAGGMDDSSIDIRNNDTRTTIFEVLTDD